MGMGRRKQQVQEEFWIATDSLPDVPQHIFYEKLNALLAEAGFDDFVEKLCEPYYAANVGRGSIPPGVYFRMLFVGYFEGIDSQRGIAWRCADSRSLMKFLGYGPTESPPDHSSLTKIRDRLPLHVHTEVFCFVLQMADTQKLLKGKTVAVDATTLEANAAMKSIVRKETGEEWKEYIKRLMQEAGVIEESDEPTDEEIRRFDKNRKNKKVSNGEWQSPADPDSRIIKMKDGRTHLGYKAEHVIDLESEFLLSATVNHGTAPDSETLLPAVVDAQANLIRAGSATEIEEAVADKGYHANNQISNCEQLGIRAYIPEPERRHARQWTDKPDAVKRAVLNTRRRTRRDKGKLLQHQRSERVERSFAHVCETGGARRSWLRGLEKVNKRYQTTVAARNLGLMMRQLFGVGTPRSLQGVYWLLQFLQLAMTAVRNGVKSSQRTRALTLGWKQNHYPLAIAA